MHDDECKFEREREWVESRYMSLLYAIIMYDYDLL